MRVILYFTTAILISVGAVREAAGQAGGSVGRPPSTPLKGPVVSPYIDLLRPGGGFGGGIGFQYFRRIRPEMEFRGANRAQDRALRDLNRRLDETQLPQQSLSSGLGTTGHPATFLNLGGYFSAGRRASRGFAR